MNEGVKRKWGALGLIPFVLVFFNVSMAWAGAWTQKKGAGYHRLAGTYYVSDHDFDHRGDARPSKDHGEFIEYAINYYGEYGLWDSVTVFGSLYYKDMEREDDYMTYSTSGVGDMDLGLRFQLYNGKLGVISLQGLVKLSAFYDEDDPMPLGNGQNDYELRLMMGRSLWPVVPGYINLEAGYRLRDEDPADEFRCLIEVGTDLGQKCYLRAKLDALVSIKNGDTATDNWGNPTHTLEYDLAKLDMTFGMKLTPALALELGCTPAMWGENTSKGTTYTIALSFCHGN